jgi:hypothetical protein
MRTSERLRKLKAWVEKELCEGREMKTPAPDMSITTILRQEPQCYLAWQPTRPDETGMLRIDPINVCPGILIMPRASYAKRMEEKRFDKYQNVHRPQELGQTLAVDILFSVYEPGVRLPGFIESEGQGALGLDMSLLVEGTEQGLFTLTDWMDDCVQKLLGQKIIPQTDLFVDEASMVYSLYTDQSFVVDKRPIYYGFVTVTFSCYAEEGTNRSIDQFLI